MTIIERIESGEKNIQWDGSLDLSGTSITALPEGLSVGSWLDLSGTSITALPEGLSVGGSLDLRGSRITSAGPGSIGGVSYTRLVRPWQQIGCYCVVIFDTVIIVGCMTYPVAEFLSMTRERAVVIDGEFAGVWWDAHHAEVCQMIREETNETLLP